MKFPRLAKFGGRLPLRFKGKDYLLRKLFGPGHPYEFTAPFFGRRYAGNTSRFIDWSVWIYGAYERGFIESWRNALKAFPNDTIMLDIGANVGHHSLAMAACGAVSKVYAFEPDSEARTILQSRIDSTITIIPSALSDMAGSIGLYRSKVSSLHTATTDGEGDPTEVVEAVRLDDWCRKFNVSAPLFVKIDVDGAEHRVLAGGKDTLSQLPVLLHLETQDVSVLSGLQRMNFRGVSLTDWYGIPRIHHLGYSENHLLTNVSTYVPIIDN